MIVCGFFFLFGCVFFRLRPRFFGGASDEPGSADEGGVD